jgi:hypothetical protein
MEQLRAYLLSDKNLTMVETIVIDKVYKTTGVSINKNDPDFTSIMLSIVTNVVRVELNNLRTNPGRDDYLKINNIMISEGVRHITSLVQEQEPEQVLSTQLEDLDEPEPQDYFEELKIDTRKPVTEVQEPVPIDNRPQFKNEVLYFDSNSSGEYKVNLNNVVSIEVVGVSIDFCDYVITEKNNCFLVDNEQKTVKVGNYTITSLLSVLNELTSGILIWSVDQVNEMVSVCQPTVSTKSITGNLRERENMKKITVDFGVLCSIGKVLGYLERTLFLKDVPDVADFKHNVNFPHYIEAKLHHEEDEDLHRIYTNVDYNSTIHYRPPFTRVIDTKGKDVNLIKFTLDYNTRGRPFTFSIKFTCF